MREREREGGGTYTHTRRQADIQTDRPTYTDRQTHRRTDTLIHTLRHTYTQTHRHTTASYVKGKLQNLKTYQFVAGYIHVGNTFN